jgi:hypothetical protein
MTSHDVHSLRTAPAAGHGRTLDWLWTWSGLCFGFRRGNSLFTYDGVEVGRFSGAEIFGVDGCYLGEVRRSEDGTSRLITNLYKRSRKAPPFIPAFDRSHHRPAGRTAHPLYCGHEEFPAPDALKSLVFGMWERVPRL